MLSELPVRSSLGLAARTLPRGASSPKPNPFCSDLGVGMDGRRGGEVGLSFWGGTLTRTTFQVPK